MSTSTTWQRRALASVGSAAAVLVLGPAAVAGSIPAAGAQEEEPPTLEASLSSTVFAPGIQMGYSSVDPCPTVDGVQLHVSFWQDGVREGDQEDAMPVFEDLLSVGEDGSWSLHLPAPEEGGAYELLSSCVTSEDDPDDGFPGPATVVHANYSPIDFEVIPDLSEDPSTNEPSPEPAPAPEPGGQAPPARPVPGQPRFTG